MIEAKERWKVETKREKKRKGKKERKGKEKRKKDFNLNVALLIFNFLESC